MTAPVRIQLSRAKGFNLQAASMAINGLPAVNVARPSQWGNPFIVGRDGTATECVRKFEADLIKFRHGDGLAVFLESVAETEAIEAQLSGRNLACWCAPDQPCHADVLLRLANMKCEEA